MEKGTCQQNNGKSHSISIYCYTYVMYKLLFINRQFFCVVRFRSAIFGAKFMDGPGQTELFSKINSSIKTLLILRIGPTILDRNKFKNTERPVLYIRVEANQVDRYKIGDVALDTSII